MADKCDLEFLEKAKGILSKKDVRDILDNFKERIKKNKQGGLDDNAAIDKTAKEMSEQIKNAGKQKTKEQLINIEKYNKNSTKIESFKNPARGFVALFGGVEGSIVKGAKLSIHSIQNSMLGKLSTFFDFNVRKLDLADTYKDVRSHVDVWDEIYGKDTGNAKAKSLAEIIKNTWGIGRALMNKAGAAIGDLLEYAGRQFHNPEKMLRLSDNYIEHMKIIRAIKKMAVDSSDYIKRLKDMAYDKWRNFILPRLDQTRTFEDADPEEMLRNVFDNIVDGKYDTSNIDEKLFQFKGPGNLAKKISRRRVLHFKDGKSAYEYNQKFGAGDLPSTMMRTMNGMSKNIGLLRELGTNPDSMVAKLKERTKELGIKRGVKVDRLIGRGENTYKGISGKLYAPTDNLFSKISVGARIVQSMAKLGGVVWTALTDVGLKADQFRANGMGYFESESRAIFSTVEGITKQKQTISDLTGTYFQGLTQQMMHAVTSIDSPYGSMTKMMNLFFKINGMSWLDEVNRRSVGEVLARHLALMKDKEFKNLDVSLQKTLNEHGIADKEWNLIRHPDNIKTAYEGKEFITPDVVDQYTDESVKNYLGNPEATPNDIANVKDNIEMNMRTYFWNNSINTNMFPGAAEQAIMYQGLPSNTVMGQIMRMIMQFKGFGISLTRRKLGRIFGASIENGFKWGDTFGMTEVKHLAELGVNLTLYGYLALTIPDLLSGKTARSPYKVKTWIASMMKGGFAGVYGDYLLGTYGRSAGRSFVDSLAGPTFDTLNDAFDLFTKLKEMDHPGTAAYYLAKNNMPLVNLWYAKAAFDYLFLYGIQEKMSPGSLSRMKRRMDKEYGQSFVFDPSEYANKF